MAGVKLPKLRKVPSWLWWAGGGVAGLGVFWWIYSGGLSSAAGTSSGSSLASAQTGAGGGSVIGIGSGGGSGSVSTSGTGLSGTAAVQTTGPVAPKAPSPPLTTAEVTPAPARSASTPVVPLARAQTAPETGPPRYAKAGYSTPLAYEAALRQGRSLPAQDAVAPQVVKGFEPNGHALYTTAFGVGTQANPFNFSEAAAAAIGGDTAAQKTLAAQGYKIVTDPATGGKMVVPA